MYVPELLPLDVIDPPGPFAIIAFCCEEMLIPRDTPWIEPRLLTVAPPLNSPDMETPRDTPDIKPPVPFVTRPLRSLLIVTPSPNDAAPLIILPKLMTVSDAYWVFRWTPLAPEIMPEAPEIIPKLVTVPPTVPPLLI